MSDETPDQMAQLVKLAAVAADEAVINLERPGHTPADLTRIAVDRAFRWAEDQGLISVTPMEQWPTYVEYQTPAEWVDITDRVVDAEVTPGHDFSPPPEAADDDYGWPR